jgi:hypothetical protein
MADEKESGGFWSSLAGIITMITGFIIAVTGLIAALNNFQATIKNVNLPRLPSLPTLTSKEQPAVDTRKQLDAETARKCDKFFKYNGYWPPECSP